MWAPYWAHSYGVIGSYYLICTLTSLDSNIVCLGALAPTALENSGQGEAAVGMTLCGGGRRSLWSAGRGE